MFEDWYVTDLIPDGPVATLVSYWLAAGWTPSSYTLRIDALKFGLTPAYLHPRNPSMARLAVGVEELGDSPDQITLYGWTVRSEFEILDFQTEADRLFPMGEVLIVPKGVSGPSGRKWEWDRKCHLAESTWGMSSVASGKCGADVTPFSRP